MRVYHFSLFPDNYDGVVIYQLSVLLRRVVLWLCPNISEEYPAFIVKAAGSMFLWNNDTQQKHYTAQQSG